MEAQNFEARKHLLEYDDVMNKQRVAIYGMRHNLLAGVEQKPYLLEVANELIGEDLQNFCGRDTHPDNWNVQGLRTAIRDRFGLDLQEEGIKTEELNFEELRIAIEDLLQKTYEGKESLVGPETMRHFERIVMLQLLDNLWKDHLLAMDHLKEGIGLRGYGQRDPLIEYKKESFEMFQDLMGRIEEESVRTMFLARIQTAEDHQRELAAQQVEMERRRQSELEAMREYEKDLERRKKKQAQQLHFSGAEDGSVQVQQVVRADTKVGRNDLCPCGSGKKYKRCHGTMAAE